MGKGLAKKVFKTAKIMNKKVGDRGFYNLRKQYATIRSMLNAQRDPLLSGEVLEKPLELYVITHGSLSKVKGMPNLPQGTTICLEYNCLIDQELSSAGKLIYVDNLNRRLLAIYRLNEIGTDNKKGYTANFVSKNLAYGVTNRSKEGQRFKSDNREIQAVLGPQIDTTFMPEE